MISYHLPAVLRMMSASPSLATATRVAVVLGFWRTLTVPAIMPVVTMQVAGVGVGGRVAVIVAVRGGAGEMAAVWVAVGRLGVGALALRLV